MNHYSIFMVILAITARILAIPPGLIGVWIECYPDSNNFIVYDSTGKFIDKRGILNCLHPKIKRGQDVRIADIDECRKNISILSHETDTVYQYYYEGDHIYIRKYGMFIEMLTSPANAAEKPQMKRYIKENNGEAIIENLITMLRREEKPAGGSKQ
jgi:hypothetical protein